MEKIPSSLRKIIKSLSTTKGRKEHKAFVTERDKNVRELLSSPFKLRWLVATQEWHDHNPDLCIDKKKIFYASESEMESMSSLSTPPSVLAVFDMPEDVSETVRPVTGQLYLALDSIQDPGNLGTIVRVADWFGVDTIFASSDTVNVFNPKCVISTMGSIARVKVVYCDLSQLLEKASQDGIVVWGTFLDGENIFEVVKDTSPTGIVVMGNEGKGISQEVSAKISQKIVIPTYPSGRHDVESLNVATATAITLATMRANKLRTGPTIRH